MWMFNLSVLLAPSEPAAYKEFIFWVSVFQKKQKNKLLHLWKENASVNVTLASVKV